MARVSNPLSTGGGGETFEARVQSQAFFIAMMLVDGSPPGLPESQTMSIRLQPRELGYWVDDLLVVAKAAEGTTHRLLAQIKPSGRLEGKLEGRLGLRGGSKPEE